MSRARRASRRASSSSETSCGTWNLVLPDGSLRGCPRARRGGLRRVQPRRLLPDGLGIVHDRRGLGDRGPGRPRRGSAGARSKSPRLSDFAALACWIAASSIWGIPERAILEAERTSPLRCRPSRRHASFSPAGALPALLSGRLGRSLRRVRLRVAHTTRSRAPGRLRSARRQLGSPSRWVTGTASACLPPSGRFSPLGWPRGPRRGRSASPPRLRCLCSSRRSTSPSAGAGGSRSQLDCLLRSPSTCAASSS